jgi:hypothetical protein
MQEQVTVDQEEIDDALPLLRYWHDRLHLLPNHVRERLCDLGEEAVIERHGNHLSITLSPKLRALIGTLRAYG